MTVYGPVQDASRHLFIPGALLYTVSPMLNLATNADSLVILSVASFDDNADLT